MTRRTVVLQGVGWIRLVGPGLRLVCERCDKVLVLPAPLPVDALPFFVRGFQEVHRFCRKGRG